MSYLNLLSEHKSIRVLVLLALGCWITTFLFGNNRPSLRDACIGAASGLFLAATVALYGEDSSAGEDDLESLHLS